MKQILLIILLGTGISITAQTLSLSFDDALRQMQQGNRSLKIADKGIEAARAERDKLNALWYPSLQGAGTFVHLSEKIEVKQPLSQFTDPAKDFVHNLVPDDQFISGILDQIGSHTLVFPLAPRNLTTVGLTAEWIVFSGGKRIRAGKIGNTMIDMARENREQTDATQRILLAESYFGLRLAQEVVRVRQDTYSSLQQHYKNALKAGGRRNDRQSRTPLCPSEHGRSATLTGSLAERGRSAAKCLAHTAQHGRYLRPYSPSPHSSSTPSFLLKRSSCKPCGPRTTPSTNCSCSRTSPSNSSVSTRADTCPTLQCSANRPYMHMVFKATSSPAP